MGLTQGITELFPVSSLGHGVLLPGVLGWHNLVNSQSKSESFFLAFIVGLHVGTALGLLVYYRKTWIALFRGLGRQLAGVPRAGVSSLWHLDDPETDTNYRLLFVLAIATVPVGIAGLLLEHKLARPVRQAPRGGDLLDHQRRDPARRRATSSQQRTSRPVQETRTTLARAGPSPSAGRRSSRSSPASREAASPWSRV